MKTLAIRIDEKDLEELRERAEALRIPVTVYARSLIVQGMRAEGPRLPV